MTWTLADRATAAAGCAVLVWVGALLFQTGSDWQPDHLTRTDVAFFGALAGALIYAVFCERRSR